MWKKLFGLFGTGGNDILGDEENYTTYTTSNTTTTIPNGTTMSNGTTTLSPMTNGGATWQVVIPNIPSGTSFGTSFQFANPQYRIILSSEKAYFLSEDEIIGLLNPCKAMVKVAQSYINWTDTSETEITLEEFLKLFRPDMFEKYKLLIEQT